VTRSKTAPPGQPGPAATWHSLNSPRATWDSVHTHRSRTGAVARAPPLSVRVEVLTCLPVMRQRLYLHRSSENEAQRTLDGDVTRPFRGVQLLVECVLLQAVSSHRSVRCLDLPTPVHLSRAEAPFATKAVSGGEITKIRGNIDDLVGPGIPAPHTGTRLPPAYLSRHVTANRATRPAMHRRISVNLNGFGLK